MATIKFLVRGTKNPSKISLRFAEGNFSTALTTPLTVNPKHFSNSKGKVKNVVEADLKDSINKKLLDLHAHIIKRYNEDAAQGIFIDSHWTKKTVNEYFNRTPNTNKDYKIFLTDYCKHFIDTSNERYTKKKDQESKPISERTKQKYNTLYSRLVEFTEKEHQRHKLTEIDLNYYKRFVAFLRVDKQYNDNTIGKYIGALKTVLNDAVYNGIKVPPQIKKFEVYTASTNDVYLNDSEIDKIFNLKLTNLRLKNARDLFIIGLRTGLRVSDFTRLHQAKIDNDFIEIETLKTGKKVTIPIHPQLKTIIENGLPHAISEQRLNDYIKEICEKAKITEMVEGAKMNPETKRKEKGIYPKFELISTHTARRSFATNLYGKIPNYAIMAITGHTKETTFLKYIKITDKENALMLQNYWKKTMTEQGYKPQMKAI